VGESKKDPRSRIEELGKGLLEMINSGANPYIEIPVRRSSNIVWDNELGLLSLGKKISRRYFINVAHARKFMQTVLVASFVKELLDEGIHASLREAFYSLKKTIPGTKENTFEEQEESNAIFVDLEVARLPDQQIWHCSPPALRTCSPWFQVWSFSNCKRPLSNSRVYPRRAAPSQRKPQAQSA